MFTTFRASIRTVTIVCGLTVAVIVGALALPAQSSVGVQRGVAKVGLQGAANAKTKPTRPTKSPKPTPAPTTPPPTTPPPTTPPPTTPPPTTPPPTPTPGTCDPAHQVVFEGATYCPGFIFEIARTVFGVGARVVVQGVQVTDVTGSDVTVMGGPGCYPDEFCGDTLPSLTVSMAGSATLPSRGDVIDLYGVTTTGGLDPVGYVVVGFCDPDLGC